MEPAKRSGLITNLKSKENQLKRECNLVMRKAEIKMEQIR
jgi:hypothetical protein